MDKGLTYSKHRKYNLASPVRRTRNWEWLEKNRFYNRERKDPPDLEIGEEVIVKGVGNTFEGIIKDYTWLDNGKIRYVVKEIPRVQKSVFRMWWTSYDTINWLDSLSYPRLKIKRKPLTRAVLFEKYKKEEALYLR